MEVTPLDLKTQNVTSQKTRYNNKPEGELGVSLQHEDELKLQVIPPMNKCALNGLNSAPKL